MTLQLCSPSNRHGGKLSSQALLLRNHEEEDFSQIFLFGVDVQPYSFAEGSQRTAFEATDESGTTFVLKRIKGSTQKAISFVDIRNYASILAKVIFFRPEH